HPAVHEAGVIAIPDPIKGEEIKAFITLNDGYETSEELLKEIRNYLEKKLSAHAAPHMLEVKEQIPKTRSGKIMRRQLKSWEFDNLLYPANRRSYPSLDGRTIYWITENISQSRGSIHKCLFLESFGKKYSRITY